MCSVLRCLPLLLLLLQKLRLEFGDVYNGSLTSQLSAP
jgi:hypothetical protein